jgi:hypothetical protein
VEHLPQRVPRLHRGSTRRGGAHVRTEKGRSKPGEQGQGQGGGWQLWSSAGPATTPRPRRGGDIQGMGDSTKWTAYQPVTLVCTGVNLFMSD